MTKLPFTNHDKARACQKHALVHPMFWMERKMNFVVTSKSSSMHLMAEGQASQLEILPQSVKGINHAN